MPKALLFEIGTEEIPAKFMPDTLDQLKKTGENKLKEYRIKFTDLKALGTPRRLVLIVEGVEEKQDSINQVVKGPAKRIAYDENGNLSKAVQGFMKSQGVTEKDLITDKVGDVEYIFAKKFEEGKETKAVLADILPEIITSLNFPKSMRWRDYSIKFARPIRWLTAVFDNEAIGFSIEGAASSNVSRGHRTLSNRDIIINSADKYLKVMADNYVIVEQEERKKAIISQIKALAESKNGKVLIDEELLEEVIYLVEYPTALMGSFEKEFLNLIKEAIITPMKEHQRYFPVVDAEGNLMPYFITVRNGGKESLDIVKQGNERVLRARLKDAQFFYNEDMKEKLEARVEKLKVVVYQEKLGTIFEKVERIIGLAEVIGKNIGMDINKVKKLSRAGLLCKADLETAMVGEFDELQGIMGREYALKNGEDPEVAEAIYSHYLPRFSGDEIPKDIFGQIISIADKMDSIVGSFGIGVQPTGSQDPYGLRRQALGIISILNDSDLNVDIENIISNSIRLLEEKVSVEPKEIEKQVAGFFRQRLKVILIDKGYRYDMVDAVLENSILNIKDIIDRVSAITTIRENEEQRFAELLTVLNRVYNLALKAEKTNVEVEVNKFENKYEQELFKVIAKVKVDVEKNIKGKLYNMAVKSLYDMINPINEFFDNNMIIVENVEIRNNRLAMLLQIKEIANKVCDFTKIVD
ncbi:MAG: glycine--tRNA ligase subunit beta [Deltaproteobacteria bacterium]